MRAFEIHTFRDGKWKMDSVFDDRELAVYEAKKIAAGSRYSGVKVVEENFDESTNLTVVRTVFRGGAAKSGRARKSAAKAKGAGPRTGSGRAPRRRRSAKPTKKQTNIMVPVLVLLILLMAGLALLFGIKYFSTLR
jgi:hypothetical protein